MNLTKAQSETLREVYMARMQRTLPSACKIGYKPAKKLVELGLVNVTNSTRAVWILGITAKGVEYSRGKR